MNDAPDAYVENEFVYIFAGSVRKNVQIHEILEGRLDFASLDPAPERITRDCAVAVKIKKRDLGRAKDILFSSDILDAEFFE